MAAAFGDRDVRGLVVEMKSDRSEKVKFYESAKLNQMYLGFILRTNEPAWKFLSMKFDVTLLRRRKWRKKKQRGIIHFWGEQMCFSM